MRGPLYLFPWNPPRDVQVKGCAFSGCCGCFGGCFTFILTLALIAAALHL